MRFCEHCRAEVFFAGGVDLDGREVKEGIVLIGRAALHDDGTYRCLANVFGALCLVEVSLKSCPHENSSVAG